MRYFYSHFVNIMSLLAVFIFEIRSCSGTGAEFFHSFRFRLVVNRHALCTAETPLAAFTLLFGSYFMLNLCYPVDAGATLEFVQQLV